MSFCKSRAHAWACAQICVVAAAAASVFRAQKNVFFDDCAIIRWRSWWTHLCCYAKWDNVLMKKSMVVSCHSFFRWKKSQGKNEMKSNRNIRWHYSLSLSHKRLVNTLLVKKQKNEMKKENRRTTKATFMNLYILVCQWHYLWSLGPAMSKEWPLRFFFFWPSRGRLSHLKTNEMGVSTKIMMSKSCTFFFLLDK